MTTQDVHVPIRLDRMIRLDRTSNILSICLLLYVHFPKLHCSVNRRPMHQIDTVQFDELYLVRFDYNSVNGIRSDIGKLTFSYMYM